MNRVIISVFWIFLTGMVTLQSVQVLDHLDAENISVSYSEESHGDEDSDERKEPDKSTGKTFSQSEIFNLHIVHFTRYRQNSGLWKNEVICPPPKA